MKILVTGASGLLGTDICREFSLSHEVFGFGRTRPAHLPMAQWRPGDIRNAAETFDVITKLNPDIVINCAAYNNVDQAETDTDEAFRVNAMGVRHLALACQRFDAILMTVSTDYVFNGKNAPEQGYREFDRPEPLSVYAESKWWGESFVTQLLTRFFVVRTSALFGGGRSTFTDKAVEWARQGKPVPCVTDMCNAPTYTPDLAKAMKQLADSGLFGVYHLTNGGFCTREEYVREILQTLKLSLRSLKPTTQAEFKMPAMRPTFSGLQNLAWKLNGFTPLRSWKDALHEHLNAQLTSR